MFVRTYAAGVNYRVISIGALAAHPLRAERQAVRTGHATTTLIESTDADSEPCRILVDPGLPAQALAARLEERAGLTPGDITHVFLTTFHPEARRALALFERAVWLLAEREREAVGVPLAQSLQRLAQNFDPAAGGDGPDPEVEQVLRTDIALLQRCQAAPDRIAEGVDLFPLPGVSPGCCGLLLTGAAQTTLVCGDAIPTAEHLAEGKVLRSAADPDAARESFAEAVEIADLLVLGRDNVVVNPTRRPF